MTTLLRLYWEFFKTGLFAVGGGMATLPFLKDIGETTGWYTYSDLMNMLAVSESTPGPIGINMATYVGFTVGGVPGAVIVAAMLKKFRDSKYVQNAFYGLRPASTGLIGAACVSVIFEVLTCVRIDSVDGSLLNGLQLTGGSLFNLRGLALAAVLLVLTNWVKPTKNLHPIVFIALSAVVGVVFGFAGA